MIPVGNNTNELLQSLNIEVSKMSTDLSGSMKAMQSDLSMAFQTAGGKQTSPILSSLAAKVTFIVVLQAAIEKAIRTRHFNTATAINDLWIHLEAARGFGSEHPSSQSIDTETMKLKSMIQKRSQMFDLLKSIMEKYDQTAKNVIQNIGR